MPYCGVRDGDGVSPFYKAWITQGSTVVVGYISGETSIALQQLWNSPFEGDSAGNASGAEKVSALVQANTGQTSKTLWNSKLVWEGAEAPSFTLTLQFLAYSNAKLEVNDPIMYLMQMSSPELNNKTPLGSIPQQVMLDIGRRIKANAVIKSVTYNEDAPKTKEGYFLSNEITLEVSLDGSVNASRIPSIFR